MKVGVTVHVECMTSVHRRIDRRVNAKRKATSGSANDERSIDGADGLIWSGVGSVSEIYISTR